MLNFYDISNNQGNINNGLVPGDGVIIKATEGIGYTDPDCDANYQQAKAAGKLLGVYHFARPDGNHPIDEANWFVSQIQGYIGEAILVLDLEVNPIDPAWAKAWLDRVYELTKVCPVIYMNKSTAEGYDWSAIMPNNALWVAAYGANADTYGYQPSANISVNGNWTILAWQYTSKGHLSNWSGYLDLDVFYGDATTWHKYAEGDISVPQPSPPPTTAPQPTPNPVPTPQPVPEPTPTPVPTPTPAPEPQPTPVPKPTQNWLVRLIRAILAFFHIGKSNG